MIRLPEKLFPSYAPVFNAGLPFLGSNLTEFGSIPAYKVLLSTSLKFSTVRDVWLLGTVFKLISFLLALKKKPVNGLAFGCTILICLLGAFGSGKLKLGAGAWLISGSGTVGAVGAVKSKEIGFFCILFGFIAALISIVTIGSCLGVVLANPYPKPNPFLAFEEAE